MKYGKKIIKKTNSDGTISIRREGYHDGLNTIEEKTMLSIQTSQEDLLTDVIRCLDQLKTDTPNLEIKIIKDDRGFPHIIQKTWVVYKEKLK